MKYILYATKDHGDGHVQKIGEYDSVEEINIHVGIFSDDVLITIELTQNE
jgi:hypothetical protein